MPRTRLLAALAFVVVTSFPAPAGAWNREHAATFAVLPEGASGPEGLEVDDGGNVYVATFGFNSAGPVAGEGQIYVFDRGGHRLRQLSVDGSTSHLLGLRFQPGGQALLVVDFGAGQVLKVNPSTGESTVFMTVPDPAIAGLNDITFDAAGNVYVSDSFQGIVWRTTSSGGLATPWVESALLRTSGIPPFGANGLRFNGNETALFVANTGNDTVVKIPVDHGAAGAPTLFTSGINGADGLVIDRDDNLWVVANQSDEIVVVDPTGRAIAKLGDFSGLRDGSPVQLLFPASLRFNGDSLLVTNLSLDLHLFGLVAVDSDWCAQVSRYTVARIPAHIPPVAGLHR